ncbi:hypothetical protein ACFQXA_33480 [Nocardiopsis composta]
MHAITRLSAEEFDAELGGLAALLAEAVADGASSASDPPSGANRRWPGGGPSAPPSPRGR